MLPEIQASPDQPDHPVFLWTPLGGAMVTPMVAEFCAQTGLSVDEAFGVEPPASPSTEDSTEDLPPTAATDLQDLSPDTSGGDTIVYKPEPTEEEADVLPLPEEDDFTINFMAIPCQPSHID